MPHKPRKNASVEIRFAPNADLISSVRRFVSTFYEDVLGDAALASRMALATHELLENAVKYATDGETRTLLEVMFEPQPLVSVCTWNRAGAENIHNLEEIFRAMALEPDAGAYYQGAMRRTATRTDGSGLGLARIQAEAEMALSCSIDGEMVAIHAELRLGNGQVK
jgi:anti-sigma regulatory factor (Ser/Thr protein kinase)